MEAPCFIGPGNLGSSGGAQTPKSRKRGSKRKSRKRNGNSEAGNPPSVSKVTVLGSTQAPFSILIERPPGAFEPARNNTMGLAQQAKAYLMPFSLTRPTPVVAVVAPLVK